MANQRDIQPSDFPKFLDVEIRTNPFGENRSGERAYRRAERIIAAVFLLTNHLHPDESLRKQVRDTAFSLLPKVLSLRDEMRTSASVRMNELQATIRHLISQVRMLVFAGLISSQNAEVMCGALDELGAFISLSQRTHLSERFTVSRTDFLDVPENYKGHVKDIRDNRVIKDKPPVTDTQRTDTTDSIETPRPITPRSRTVIDVLRSGGDMNVRDIAAYLPEYGEKTIQRELSGLITQGVVKRSGLKRWSRYSIA